MRVATYYNNQDIRIEERPVPKIDGGELLVKIEAAGICGSDVTEWYRTGKVGRVLGHEVAGTVVERGGDVNGYRAGDRIACSHHVPCYQCHFCRLGYHTLCDTLRTTNFDPGGFAEWVRLSPIHVRFGVYPLPKNVSYEEGTFVEPLACTWRAQQKARVRPSQTLLVLGSGIAGLLHILVGKVLGADRVIATDVNPFRLAAAQKAGADFVFTPSAALPDQIRSVNEGRLADVVIACSGKPSVTEQALQTAERGGTVLFFALHHPNQKFSLPFYEIFWEKGLTLMNSYAASPEDHREVLNWMSRGHLPVQPLISHRFPFAQIGEGFALVAKADQSLKVIIEPQR